MAKNNIKNFIDVTETPNQLMSKIQLSRLYTRYYWTRDFCVNKDVLEVACGAGTGLGLIKKVAKSIEASDYQEEFVTICRKSYEDIKILQYSAESLPHKDKSKDVIVMHEALYYLEKPELFIAECKRVLRKSGFVLLSNSNKDIFDFNPSPHSTVYHGVLELNKLFQSNGFKTEFWASEKIKNKNLLSFLLRIIKLIAVKMNIIPKTMGGKTFLKSIFFGKLINMPRILEDEKIETDIIEEIDKNKANKTHKILYVKANLK